MKTFLKVLMFVPQLCKEGKREISSKANQPDSLSPTVKETWDVVHGYRRVKELVSNMVLNLILLQKVTNILVLPHLMNQQFKKKV